MGAVGALLAIGFALAGGYSVYDIISTGSWHDWTVKDWLWNIFMIGASFFPWIKGGAITAVGGTTLVGKILAKVGFLRVIAEYLSIIKNGSKLLSWAINYKFFAKDSLLWRVGSIMWSILKFARKPCVLAGLLVASASFRGITRRLYELYGDVALWFANRANCCRLQWIEHS